MKYVIATILALLVGSGFALELPDGSAVVATDAAGAVVGYGAFEDGVLELAIGQGASGFLTLTFTSEDGVTMQLDVMVSVDGTIVVADTLADLSAHLSAGGGAAVVTQVPVADIEAVVERLEDAAGRGAGTAEEHARAGLDVADEAAGEHGAHGRAIARTAPHGDGPPDLSDVPGNPDLPQVGEGSEVEDESAGAGIGGGVAGSAVGEAGLSLPSRP